DRDVPWDAPAVGGEHRKGTGGHQVRGGKDGVKIWPRGEQRGHGVRAARLREIASGLEPRIGNQPRLGDGVAVTGQSVEANRHVRWTGDSGDDPAAAGNEVLHGAAGALPVVAVDLARIDPT